MEKILQVLVHIHHQVLPEVLTEVVQAVEATIIIADMVQTVVQIQTGQKVKAIQMDIHSENQLLRTSANLMEPV